MTQPAQLCEALREACSNERKREGSAARLENAAIGGDRRYAVFAVTE